MTVRILIVDGNAANRILMRATLQSAHYDAALASSFAQAQTMIDAHCPDLILLGLTGEEAGALGFCATLRADPRTARVPLIAVAGAAPTVLRLAMLTAGADDVLDRTAGQVYLLARIRSLVRARAIATDLNLREETHRALGLADDAAPFVRPGHVAVITGNLACAPQVLAGLVKGLAGRTQLLDPKQDLSNGALEPAPDLFVIDGTSNGPGASDLFRMVADLRTRPGTRHAATLVMLPPDCPDLGALILDLGASDITSSTVSAAELAHRIQALLRQKSESDRLRDRLSHGLEAAVTDPLTGLHNRRYALPQLDRIAQETSAAGRGLALMMLDIDHFKAVNDAHGHAAGDRVLAEVARRLRACLRPTDLIARVGGEEFVVALRDATPVQAQATAERLRRVIADSSFDFNPAAQGFTHTGAAPLRLGVTLSIGLAFRDGCDRAAPQGADHLIERADRALYAAKAAGRNRVGLAGSLAAQSAA